MRLGSFGISTAVVAIASGAVIFTNACGGGGSKADAAGGEAPEAAFKRQLQELADGQTSKAYAELVPQQRAFIPEALYQKCVSGAGSFDIGNVNVKSVYDEQDTIPGTDVRMASKAITAEIELKRGLLSNKTTDTYHEYLIDGKWLFAVANGDAYKAGKCP